MLLGVDARLDRSGQTTVGYASGHRGIREKRFETCMAL